jgi:hypothetical protein
MCMMFTSSDSRAWITLEDQNLFWSTSLPLTSETLISRQTFKSRFVVLVHNINFQYEIEFMDEPQFKKFLNYLTSAPHSSTIKLKMI